MNRKGYFAIRRSVPKPRPQEQKPVENISTARALCANLLSDLVDKNGEIRMKLTWRFGIYLYSDGRYNEAEVSFMEVAERRKKVLGAEHLDTLISIANLASTYRN
jgi:hypothetical protein